VVKLATRRERRRDKTGLRLGVTEVCAEKNEELARRVASEIG
jgi:hypothetical protein